LKNSVSRLFKAASERGAREIDAPRRTYRVRWSEAIYAQRPKRAPFISLWNHRAIGTRIALILDDRSLTIVPTSSW
jgi:hypothetical protein